MIKYEYSVALNLIRIQGIWNDLTDEVSDLVL